MIDSESLGFVTLVCKLRFPDYMVSVSGQEEYHGGECLEGVEGGQLVPCPSRPSRPWRPWRPWRRPQRRVCGVRGVGFGLSYRFASWALLSGSCLAWNGTWRNEVRADSLCSQIPRRSQSMTCDLRFYGTNGLEWLRTRPGTRMSPGQVNSQALWHLAS